MHIPEQIVESNYIENLAHELEILIEQPTAKEDPPCPNCTAVVDDVLGSCSSCCGSAPKALSEDPERYPIEKNVVSIVFELASLRVIQPCWSCEGHLDTEGNIWKYPQISFYSNSPIYAQLICNYLCRLHIRQLVKYLWEVVLTNYGKSHVITYTIKCSSTHEQSPSIYMMQKDLQVISDGLAKKIKDDARAMLSNLNM